MRTRSRRTLPRDVIDALDWQPVEHTAPALTHLLGGADQWVRVAYAGRVAYVAVTAERLARYRARLADTPVRTGWTTTYISPRPDQIEAAHRDWRAELLSRPTITAEVFDALAHRQRELVDVLIPEDRP